MSSTTPEQNGTGSSTGTLTTLMGVVATAKEKWDSSGANEAMTSMANQIPAGTKEYITETSKQFFKREHLRSITIFFGIGEERPFYVEKAPSLLLERLRHNVRFFYLNYMLLLACLFVLTLLISPSAVIGLGLLALAWVGVARATQNGIKVLGFTITQTHATIVMAGISVMVLLYLLSGVFWWTLFFGGFLVGVHAFMRDASLHKDEEDKMEMQGDLTISAGGGEDAAFLNDADAKPPVV